MGETLGESPGLMVLGRDLFTYELSDKTTVPLTGSKTANERLLSSVTSKKIAKCL